MVARQPQPKDAYRQAIFCAQNDRYLWLHAKEERKFCSPQPLRRLIPPLWLRPSAYDHRFGDGGEVAQSPVLLSQYCVFCVQDRPVGGAS